MKYRVVNHYRSGWGALTRGDIVDLDEDIAAWLLRDSPGCIEPFVEKPPEPPRRAVEAPESNRMVQAAPIKRVAHKPAKAAQDGE